MSRWLAPLLLAILLPRGASAASSECLVGWNGAAPDRAGTVQLVLEGMSWSDWPDACRRLTRYLDLQAAPYPVETSSRATRRFDDTGYFSQARCQLDPERRQLSCALVPATMVRAFDVDGTLPFTLLRDDLRRRVFLRNGTLLQGGTTLSTQAARMEEYLRRDGYFVSLVRVSTAPVSGAEPNLGVELHAEVSTGTKLELRQVRIEGDSGLPASELEEAFRHYWIFAAYPRRFTPNAFNADLEQLRNKLHDAGWPEAELRGRYQLDLPAEAVDVTLTTKLGPKLSLYFEDNHFFEGNQLAEMATFKSAGRADRVEAEKTAEAIRKAYQEAGYFEAEVSPRIRELDPKRREISYRIAEGRRAQLVELSFSGTSSDAHAIRKHAGLLSSESGLFWSGRWVDSRVAHDRRAIEEYLHSVGYAIATATASRVVLEPGKLALRFGITRGPRRMVDRLMLRGLPSSISASKVSAQLELVAGKPFVEAHLEQDRRQLLLLLAGEGYPKAKIHRQVAAPPPDAGGLVEIDYTVLPGDRATLGGVLVRGNFRTQQGMIENELSLSPGDPLDLVALGEAKQRLRTLGIFGTVEVRALDPRDTSAKTWLMVELEERELRTLDLVASFATDDLFGVGLDYKDPNLIGRAIRTELKLRLSNASQLLIPQARIGNADLVQLTVRAPRPFGFPFDTEYSGVYELQDKPLYAFYRFGPTATVFRTLLARTACALCPSVIGSLRYELTQNAFLLKDSSAQLSGRAQTLSSLPNQTIARVIPRLVISALDSAVDPRQGYHADLRFELGQPWLAGPIAGAPGFWRLIATAAGYLDLGSPFHSESDSRYGFGGPFVIALGADYGIALPLGATRMVPLSESFAYGGDLSVRGLEERASAVGIPNASYLLTGSAELRWYLFQSAIAGSIQLALLSDLGMVAVHLGDLLQEPTVSAGGALRYITPIGPLSLAYAVAFVRAPSIVAANPSAAPAQGRLHLTFGYAF